MKEGNWTPQVNGADIDATLSRYALANTQPLATSGLPTGVAFGSRVIKSSPRQGTLEYPSQQRRRTFHEYSLPLAGPTFRMIGPATARPQTRVAGQVKLFQIVVREWGFTDTEAATLLGFETAADIHDIWDGRRPVAHRDANDRLRAALRIAGDLEAIYGDKEVIRKWLNQSQEKLGGSSPKQLLTEGSMESVLLVKYYMAHLSGR